MRLIFVLAMLIRTVGIAQVKDTVYNLGPVYRDILQQQEELKKQLEGTEKARQGFIVGYFSGKERLLTSQDSIVFIEPDKIKILTKRKKK